jgi:hypothetical protein
LEHGEIRPFSSNLSVRNFDTEIKLIKKQKREKKKGEPLVIKRKIKGPLSYPEYLLMGLNLSIYK